MTIFCVEYSNIMYQSLLLLCCSDILCSFDLFLCQITMFLSFIFSQFSNRIMHFSQCTMHSINVRNQFWHKMPAWHISIIITSFQRFKAIIGGIDNNWHINSICWLFDWKSNVKWNYTAFRSREMPVFHFPFHQNESPFCLQMIGLMHISLSCCGNTLY